MAEKIENNKNNGQKVNENKIIDENIEDIVEEGHKGYYNFLVNASNQASLSNSCNASPLQVNAVFVVVSPYYIEKFNLEGVDLDISINEKGTVQINNQEFNTLEIKPGVKIFGISKCK